MTALTLMFFLLQTVCCAEEITTKSGVGMVYVAGGTFTMGEPFLKDAPPHNVVLKSFYIDKFEVTQEMYESLMGSNPSKWSGKKNPVECVRWKQAILYCNARSKKEGLTPCYDANGRCDFSANGYRLPTEAEWEYACQAGKSGKYSFGNNAEMLKEFSWYKGNSEKKPHSVGLKKPNSLGIFDMHGNVWEWCNDYYDPNYYREANQNNPHGAAKGVKRVLRGGSWKNNAANCTSAYRLAENPACSDICLGYDNYGFRCVRNAEPEQKTASVSEGSLNQVEIKNDYIAVKASAVNSKVELYSKLQGQWLKAGQILPLGLNAENIQKLTLKKNDNGLIITYVTSSGKEQNVTIIIKNDCPVVEMIVGEGLSGISINVRHTYGVLPDLYANDMILNSKLINQEEVRLPNEYVYCDLVDDCNAILTYILSSRKQQITLKVENNQFTQTEITCGPERKVWMGLSVDKGIWHVEDINEFNILEDKELVWQVPFPAKWCANYERDNGINETFGCLCKNETGFDIFSLAIINPESRSVWMSTRSIFIYPFFVENQKAYVRIPTFPGHEEILYKSNVPMLIYPIEANAKTPKDRYAPLDLVRLALRDVPESNLYEAYHVKINPKAKYPSTCEVTEKVENIFDDQEEKAKREEICSRIKAMDEFVKGIRERVEEYRTWCKSTEVFCRQQAEAHSEVNDISSEIISKMSIIETKYNELLTDMQSPEQERLLSAAIVQVIDSNAIDMLEQVQELCRKIRTIGGAQDKLVGYCRQILMEIKQSAGSCMLAENQDVRREFLQAIRERINEFTYQSFYHESGVEATRR
jgi:formylglycine-generating enzyme required for sulfatase activity